jgi:ATP-dependent DNA ligase
LPLPRFSPASPTLRPAAFDHDDFIFELKMDGFRALAHVGPDATWLVSRKGNVYKSVPGLCAAIRTRLDCEAVVDGRFWILMMTVARN